MKLLIPITAVIAAILAVQPVLAQAQAAKPREFEEFISKVPKQDLLKLRGGKQAEAAAEISKKIAARELNKEGTFRLTIDRVEPWRFPNDGTNGWRVHAKNERIKEGSTTLDLACWVYVREDANKVLENVRTGKDLIVTGQVSRADVMIIQGNAVLNVDLQATQVRAGK